MLLVVLALVQACYSLQVFKCCPPGFKFDSAAKFCSQILSESELRVPEIIPQDTRWTYKGDPCTPHQSELIKFDEEPSIVFKASLVVYPGTENITYPPNTFCIEYMDSETSDILVAKVCPCTIATCVRKCCPMDEIVETPDSINATCISHPNVSEEWHPRFETAGVQFYILNGFPQCLQTGLYFLNDESNKEHTEYAIQNDGSIKLSNSRAIISLDSYCGDTILRKGKLMDNLILCLKTSHSRGVVQQTIYSVLLVIGSLFLFLTLIVHYSLSELRRTLHSKNLTSHTLSLLVAYTVLTVQSLGYTPSSSVVCAVLGYLTQLSFLAAFFWLNVMCVDITWTFSGFRIPEGNSLNESEGKKFCYYSIYVWGSTLIIVLITLITDLLSSGTSIAPDLGSQKCWFKGKLPTLLFFYLPISILLLTNVFLFLYTSFKIIKVRRDTVALLRQDGMRPSCSNFQRFSEFRFTLYLKLSLLMGITWIFEVIAWAADDEEKYYYFYIFTDAVNALRGVFVFFLFCRKRKLISILRSKMTNINGTSVKMRRRRTIKNSSSKSYPDSSTLYTSNQTQQTNAE